MEDPMVILFLSSWEGALLLFVLWVFVAHVVADMGDGLVVGTGLACLISTLYLATAIALFTHGIKSDPSNALWGLAGYLVGFLSSAYQGAHK